MGEVHEIVDVVLYLEKACFENAILRVARDSDVRFADPDVEVIAEIGFVPTTFSSVR